MVKRLQAFFTPTQGAALSLKEQLEAHGFTLDTWTFDENDLSNIKEITTYVDMTFNMWSKPTIDGAPLFWKHSRLVAAKNNLFDIETPHNYFNEGDTLSNIDHPTITRKVYGILQEQRKYVLEVKDGVFDVMDFGDAHTEYERVPSKVMCKAGYHNISLQRVSLDALIVDVTAGSQQVPVITLELQDTDAKHLANAILELYKEDN